VRRFDLLGRSAGIRSDLRPASFFIVTAAGAALGPKLVGNGAVNSPFGVARESVAEAS
jgi:hypothetical protein